METNVILQGDCLARMRELPDESVNCCVTSPPYWGLRDYGVDGQLGLEATPEEYVQHMVKVFREVRRILKTDGTLWLNLGDSYAGSGKGAWANHEAQKEVYVPEPGGIQTRCKWQGLKSKDLVGIPWMVAFALRADGWYLRSDIIWAKPNPMPESVTDRPTKSHEYIFLLSKNPRYYYDYAAIKEPMSSSSIKRFEAVVRLDEKFDETRHKNAPGIQIPYEILTRASRNLVGVTDRNKRSVWRVPTQSTDEAHFATFPPELIRPCILAGCPVGGVVLDPFGGSGTTAQVAIENCRKFLLTELNPAYIEIAMRRLRPHLAQQKLIEV